VSRQSHNTLVIHGFKFGRDNVGSNTYCHRCCYSSMSGNSNVILFIKITVFSLETAQKRKLMNGHCKRARMTQASQSHLCGYLKYYPMMYTPRCWMLVFWALKIPSLWFRPPKPAFTAERIHILYPRSLFVFIRFQILHVRLTIIIMSTKFCSDLPTAASEAVVVQAFFAKILTDEYNL
jgi:hypothetical protein